MELMSGLYVHGGDGSDNLFLLDGVPVYQVNHLGGMFSAFNTDITESLDFYKSGFPARYGGRLSSVVDITTSDGDMQKFGGSFTIGLIDGRIRLHGPIVKRKLSFDVAVRRTWLDAFTSSAYAIMNRNNPNKKKNSYSFTDANASLTYQPSESDKLKLSFFTGIDYLNHSETTSEKFYGEEIYTGESGENLKLRWGNLTTALSWQHTISERTGLRALAYFSKATSNIFTGATTLEFADDVMTTTSTTEHTLNNVLATGGKFAVTSGFKHHSLHTGVDYQHNWYRPERTATLTPGNSRPETKESNSNLQSDEISIHAEDAMTYGPFKMNIGLRLDGYFQGGKVMFHLQPRASVQYNPSKVISLHASYTNMVQYNHLVSSVFLDLPTNLWMPATDRVKPSESHQVAAGISANFLKHWRINLDGYYKTIRNCVLYSGSSSLFPPVEEWESNLAAGKGRAYGAELEAGYTSDKWNATVFYTLSWSKRLFEDLHPDWFDDRFDNRHKITVTALYRINRMVELSAQWNYHSGNRVTMPEQIADGENGPTLLYPKPYNAKMPDYHRLDIGCNIRRISKRGHEQVWNVSICNVYCRMNPIMMSFCYREDGTPAAKLYSIVPIIPSFSYTIKF